MNGNLFSPSTDSNEWLTAHCDGGSRGNPGPSGYGAVIEDAKGKILVELSEFVGIQTNNFAEYSGLLGVLKWSVEHKVKRLRVISDSELMVKQMQGKYKVASPILKPLFDEAKRLARNIESFEMRHTLRGGNKEADRLANEAMDRGMGKAMSGPVSANAYAPKPVIPTTNKPAIPTISRPTQPQPAKPAMRQVLEGYVKDGVVHLLEGELPDGIFVKVVRE